MQVGAVNDGGKGKKGKSKSTGDKGKGSNDGDKTKGRGYWNSGQQYAQFQGYCFTLLEVGPQTCGLSNSFASTENGAVAGAQEPESEAEDVKAAQWSDADSDGADLDSSSWCFAALNNPRGPAGTLLVDSGADDHICHPDFAKEFPH